MKLQQLEYYLAIVDEKSYTKASQKLYVTRQAVSQAVRQLEADLGCRLLAVTDRGVVPTPLGKELYEQGTLLLKDARELEQRIRQRAASASSLRVAVSDTLLPNLEPDLLLLLHSFSQENTGAIACIDEIPNDQLPAAVQGEYDFGLFLGEQKQIPGLTLIPYRREPLAFTLPLKHPLLGKDPVSIRDLKGLTLMVPGEPDQFFPTLANECRENGFELSYKVVTPGIEGAYLAEKEGLITCDIPWDYYSTRYSQKRPADSKAEIVFQMIYKEKADNYFVQHLEAYLSERLGRAKGNDGRKRT